TQQIIAYETGVANTVDPLAGSYLVEYLTDDIERRSMDYIRKIEAMGGALAAIDKGYLQAQLQEEAYAFHKAVESGERIVLGVNAFRDQEPGEVERLTVDPSMEERQKVRLAALRARRDGSRVSQRLDGLEAAARSGDENLMPLFIDCAEQDVTLGEMCRVLRRVWGEHRPRAGA
ncbi:MAG: methylmalonyl-CoA mutase family protein, partial [Candidatus Aminicenantes bacterium]|nr:methylmalonyl-CoA mutase family protein [Candidatus Aminicenantes bacterium]